MDAARMSVLATALGARVDAHTDRDGVAHVELTATPRPIELGAAPVCRLLMTFRGVPVAWPEIANPGPGGERALLELLVGPARAELLARAAAADELRRRLSAVAPELPAPPVSVVVCTHRRPRALCRLLDALTALDPAPAEVIVVDNDPGPDDCREAVTAAGFRYVREDARGLDRARTTGLRAATGDVVAFTDDDCVPAPTWLARLPRHFADPSVAAVTGPAFAWTLGAPAQARFEREDGFQRGLRERVHTWATVSPSRASAAGAGANMAFRRAALLALADPFPAALDAGTPTQSGGDMWALAELLAGGRRLVYDPGVWVWHEHRPDPAALHRALWGYGVGYASTLLALATRRGEGGAARAAVWLLDQYASATVARATGRSDAVRQRLGWEYLRGGLAAPRRYWASLRAAGAGPSRAPVAVAASSDAVAPSRLRAGPAPTGDPAISIVVPTFRRPRALARLLDSLAAQAGAPPFEVVVIDDEPGARCADRTRELRQRCPFPLRVIAGGGGGAARARNRGATAARAALLLFLDDDLVAGPALVHAHAAAHASATGPAVVIGSCPPRPARRTFAADGAAWWWWDQLAVRRGLARPGFKEVLSGNMSMPADAFDALGGFEARFAAFRREDWELGLRVAAAGIPVRLLDAAEAVHEFDLDTARHVANGYAEGRGDALLVATHPEAAAAVPLGSGYARLPRRPLRALALLVLERERARDAAVAVLERLERHRARAEWARLAGVVHQAAYRAGIRAGGCPRAARVGPDLVVDLGAADPIVVPPISSRVAVRSGDEQVTLQLPEIRGDHALADAIADRVPWALLRTGAPSPRPPRQADAVPVLAHDGAGGWRAVDRAIRDTDAGHLVVTLPGVRADAAWAAQAARALEGERVALVCGAGTLPGELPHALDIFERRMLPDRLLPRGLPPQAVALDRDAYLAAGGFDPALDRHGPLVGLLDLVERLLDAGWVIGSYAGPGLDPPGTTRWRGRRLQWARHRALGVLVWRHGGATWVARRTVLRLALDLAGAAVPGGNRRRRALRTAAEAHGWVGAARDPDMGFACQAPPVGRGFGPRPQ
jgi:glycosyltransferase involved in cell wall biosynthesis